jgi:hypothetical protein
VGCVNALGDYACQGWRARAAAIRRRDGERCRGCNRGADEVRLEVHHRLYGKPGAACGDCVLTAVADEDLSTYCADCHLAITDVVRRLRYGARAIEPAEMPRPASARAPVIVRVEITADPLPAPAACGPVPAWRADLW